MKSQFDTKKLLSQMTLDEKIGQLIQLDANCFGDNTAAITGPMSRRNIDGKYLSCVGSTLNFTSVENIIDAQKKHMDNDRNHIPLMFMLDVIHGFRTIYPIPLALGASFDPAIVEECCRMAAREASACGIHLTFAPMVDYARDARWGRVMETCGEEPLLNGVMGAAQVRGYQGEDLSNPDSIAACVKHFAAYGGAEAGLDYNMVEISERLMREYYLPAYKACIDADVKMLMSSFNVLNGVPAVANKWLMNKVLRDEWKYNGVTISDYSSMEELISHGVAADAKQTARLGMEAGCDIDMMSFSYYRHLRELVDEGVISEQSIDEAVLRVLDLKRELGLFEDPYRGASVARAERELLTSENRDIARRAAEASAILLKNESVLPFSERTEKIAIIGPFADNKQIKGSWSCKGVDDECVSVAEGVRRLLPKASVTVVKGCSEMLHTDDTSEFEAARLAAKDADAVILCLGERENYSGESASRTDITLPGVQNELAKAVLSENSNAAVVVFGGRPLALTELDAIAPAILDVFFPGTEGGTAVADLLFGRANPSGKVTMSFPRCVGQCPIYYNRTNTGRPKPDSVQKYVQYQTNYVDEARTPLYPFGYGLSYSKFVYEDMTIDADTLCADGEINVTVTVRNDSDRDGKEVVQLYMHDLVASSARPIQQLIGFEKVDIAAHTAKTVCFKVTEPMLRFYNFECEHISEPGEFTLSTGYADNLIHTKKFKLI